MKKSNSNFEVHNVSPLNGEVRGLIEQLNRFNLNLYSREECRLESAEHLFEKKADMVGVFDKDQLVGIGAVKQMEGYAEVKRMFVQDAYRGTGVAATILEALEDIARKNGNTIIRLETGALHKAALKFYHKMGYYRIRQFGDYPVNDVSVLMEKKIGTL